MDPHEELRARVAPPGSSLYYGLLFADPRDRRPLCAAAAWQQEARRLAFAPRERPAALARIDWWQEEAQRLRAGSPPRHPIAQALAGGEAAATRAAGESVQRMLDTVRQLVLSERVMREEELWQHCDALGSEGEQMIADALATPRRGAHGILEELGRGLEMLELTRPPPGHRHITPRMIPLAHDEARAGHPEASGDPGRCSPAMGALLRGRGERAERLLDAALRRLVDLPVPPERSRVVLARLALAQVGILAHSGYRRWDLGPSPLRKLWIAWRAVRR